MRGGLLVALLLLAACNPGVSQRNRVQENKAEAPVRTAQPAPEPPPSNQVQANEADPAPRPSAVPPDPALADMSPYRRREYERGYRDCLSGNFDGERQGESYRIGCMAAQERRAPGAR